jgi:hypothetical protein
VEAIEKGMERDKVKRKLIYRMKSYTGILLWKQGERMERNETMEREDH